MSPAELKTAIESIAASMPIRTTLRRGNEVSYEDRFPGVRVEGSAIVVNVAENATTGRKEAVAILNAVRKALAAMPGSEAIRVSRKSTSTGYWHMGRFCEDGRYLKFWLAQ